MRLQTYHISIRESCAHGSKAVSETPDVSLILRADAYDISLLLLVRSINERAARRISSATRASGDTNFGVNHGNNPIKSCVTRICPSQCLPEPIPIVGMSIALVICFATSATTISSTTENAPACCTTGVCQQCFDLRLRAPL